MKDLGQQSQNGAHAGTPNGEWTPFGCNELIERLAARRAPSDRYTVVGEVGRGEMGRVLRVRDEDLHRDLAMKVLRDDDEPSPRENGVTPQMLLSARFIEEAQVAAQLDHPGIVPVHDVGLDAQGRMYFTMKLVRGRTLERVLEMARDGTDGWSTTRVLGVLLRVCEAMSYAHERGVLHRDLKPSNIMIGHHGEVFVMDWGLARLIARPRKKPSESESGELYSARQSGSGSGSSSPFVTEDGRILGTPSFMSPEQARGDGGALGPASDVYAVGAMLYQALCGRAPYSKPGKKLDNRHIWLQLQSKPPEPLIQLAPRTSAELVSICEKAMARTLVDRYATMADMADDLRAYLEVRAVSAHKTGPLTEFRKWVSRNKTAAAALSALVLVLTTAGFLVAWSEQARLREAGLRAAAHTAASVRREAREWKIEPASVTQIDTWLARARTVLADADARSAELAEYEQAMAASGRGRFLTVDPDPLLEKRISWSSDKVKHMRAEVERLRAMATAQGSDAEQKEIARSGLAVLPAEIEWLDAHLGALDRLRGPARRLEIEENVERERHGALAGLVADQRRLAVVDVPAAEADLVAASDAASRSVAAETTAWEAAIASIADPNACPAYNGLKITPQMGLVPLRRDPDSGLWEFWHVLSGARPEEGPDHAWKIGADTGIVLVLIPGGDVTIGSQKDHEDETRFDPDAQPNEILRRARLDPYFIGKHEVTQGQWMRIGDDAPSHWFAGTLLSDGARVTRANPVENVDWTEAAAGLRRVGLDLPTELQWENAARGASDARFGAWDTFDHARAHANLSTSPKVRNLPEARDAGRDGWLVHSPVDALAANGFGLFGTLGNVSEWCRDWAADECDNNGPARDGDGEIVPPVRREKIVRGGDFRSADPKLARVSVRRPALPSGCTEIRGIRAARPVER